MRFSGVRASVIGSKESTGMCFDVDERAKEKSWTTRLAKYVGKVVEPRMRCISVKQAHQEQEYNRSAS